MAAIFAGTLVASFAAMLASVSVAFAGEGPRWMITAVPTPTNIQANSPRNEVQRVTVNATGGTFALEVLSPGSASFQGTVALPYDATAAEVQTALDGVAGAEGATVTGGPGSVAPYEVTFTGENDGNVAIEPMRVNTAGLSGSGTVTETVKGAAPPELIITATNVGGANTNGEPIVIKDLLPSWLTATSVSGFDVYAGGFGVNGSGPASMACSTSPISCSYEHSVDPGDQLIVTVTLAAGAVPVSGATTTVEVSGGGAPEATVHGSLGGGSGSAGFGPAPGSVGVAISDMQAGAHPNVTTMFEMATSETDESAGDPKDIRFDLPPGLVGSTVGMPRCSMNRVVEAVRGGSSCPNDTMVGTATISLTARNAHPFRFTLVVPVYNIAPAPGEPAAFGFDAVVLPVRLDTTVLSNGNYGVRVTAPDLPESEAVLASNITIWGVPAEHSGPGSNGEFTFLAPNTYGGVDTSQSPVPLLTNPQQCVEPLTATMSTDPWAEQGVFRSVDASLGTLTDCDLVPFSSSFSFLPDTLEAGAPAGYSFDLNVPQQNTAGTLATSSVKDVRGTLPEGVVVNPSAAWGLKACSSGEFYGAGHPSQAPAGLAECPREAQVGEVEVETPDLEHPLKGQVFLGTPECDPCSPQDAQDGRMVRLFVQLVGEGEAGIVVKLEGRALVDQRTGQITTVFDGTPQVPFNRMRFVLEGGPRAVLANPRVCGPVKASGDLTPWNTGPGISDSLPFYEFEIDQGCFGPQFSPSFVAGTPNIQAGAYTPFTLAFGRSDHDEFLGRIEQSLPPGLLGNIASVPLCREPQAAQGTCPEGSLIGHVQALTGPGADPFLVSGGKVFLTEGYEGAPYGLSIVVPAVAGPYTLSGTTGHGTVVVRARIVVDPIDAHLTVISDPLPSMLDGIPLQLKAVNVTIDRPGGFTFNPTSCAKMAIKATLVSTEGLSANLASSFQVTNCATLAFKPHFKVFTNGRTSRKSGASLTVDLSYPKASWGSQANIRSVKVDLPKQLPSFLNTLQKACPGETFQADPAACPSGSIVGSATATTPILPVPLAGPAYFVSHGGAKWPELVIVLSGYGVTVQLHGETFINEKTKVTSSTFRTIPDVPIGTFQLNLPQGPNHALAANGSLCAPTRVIARRERVRVNQHGHTRTITRNTHKRIATSLAMPTAFTAQNGMIIHQNTPITVTGCTRAKSHHNKHKHHKHKKK